MTKNEKKKGVAKAKWLIKSNPTAWHSFEIHPASAWNYSLVLDSLYVPSGFSIEKRAWPADNFPFTTSAAPLVMKADARIVGNWVLDQYGLCSPLPDSPVHTEAPVEKVELIPMGAARLRISAFPVAAGGGKE
jgi:hypothetical protein